MNISVRKLLQIIEVNYHYLERGDGGSISLTLRSLKSNTILSALKYIIGPEFVCSLWAFHN